MLSALRPRVSKGEKQVNFVSIVKKPLLASFLRLGMSYIAVSINFHSR